LPSWVSSQAHSVWSAGASSSLAARMSSSAGGQREQEMQLGDVTNWRGHSAKEIGAGYSEVGGGVEGTKHERGAVNAENYSSYDPDMYILADPDMYNSVQDAQKGRGGGGEGAEEDGFPRVLGPQTPAGKGVGSAREAATGEARGGGEGRGHGELLMERGWGGMGGWAKAQGKQLQLFQQGLQQGLHQLQQSVVVGAKKEVGSLFVRVLF